MTTERRMNEGLAPKAWYTTYQLHGVRYVPHYRNTKLYVGPGFPKEDKTLYTPDELLEAGGVPSQSYLFTRSDTEDDRNELIKSVRTRMR